MKLTPAVLAVSLAANLALGALIAVKAPSLLKLPGSSPHPAPAGAPSPAAGSAPAGLPADVWASLKSDDMRALVARLKAAGFPPAVVRAVAAVQMHEQFAARRRALFAGVEDAPYWKGRGPFAALDPKLQGELRALGKEETAAMKELFGPDSGMDDGARAFYQRRQFGNLPAAKMDQVQDVVTDYNDLRNQIYSSTGGTLLPEDRDKIAMLEKEQAADLAKILTPDELFEYQIRSSQTAQQLRNQLAIFNPSEDEFRALFKVDQSFADQLGPMVGPQTSEQVAAREAAQADLLAQAQATVGSDRAAQLAEALDPRNFQLNQVIARMGLPQQAAMDVAAIQQDVTKQVMDIRTNGELSRAERTSQLAAAAADAMNRITGVLGPSGYQTYKQTSAAYWMQGIVPRPAPRPAR